ncbi:MAG: hypothetical protein H6586_04350 [Flavobacteriales bacterium]|nr:hypothetical protein [Leptospiraceae bacterium]MCB9335355.1 hypothetical protein [Flavobacteriales bacterium]
MDSIQEVILSMDQVQQKEFVSFIQRNKYRKGRKDLQLFNLLKEEKERKPKELVKLLQTSNMNAYHTIRKRLFNHLADFFILKSTSSEANPTSYINGIIGVVNYLFDRGLTDQGWKYLKLAENLATQYHYSDILNSIYLLQIEKCHLQKEIHLNDVIINYQKNHELLKQDEKLKIAMSVVRDRFDQLKQTGVDIDFQNLIVSTLNRLEIDKNVLQTPRVVLLLVKIVRTGIIAKKDFYDFEPYLIKEYNRLYKNSDEDVNYMVKAEFLYLIAHTCYRNKKFSQSLNYLMELGSVIDQCSVSFQNQFKAKTIQLVAANKVFLGELLEAIDDLSKLYKIKSKLSNQENLNTIVNLGIYKFLNKDYKASLALLNDFTHSDNWYKKVMGVEWVLKRNLMEVLLFIELGFDDLVESRIRSIERNYADLKMHPIYKKAFNYLVLLKDYLNNNQDNPSKLHEEMLKRLEFVPYEQEDIQAMAFYAWIKSKAIRQNFYPTLLGLIK